MVKQVIDGSTGTLIVGESDFGNIADNKVTKIEGVNRIANRRIQTLKGDDPHNWRLDKQRERAELGDDPDQTKVRQLLRSVQDVRDRSDAIEITINALLDNIDVLNFDIEAAFDAP